MSGQVIAPEWGGERELVYSMSIAISTGELPKRYIAPLFVSLDACVVQRLARHSETPHGYTATKMSRPVYRYVTVVGYLKISKLFCEPST